MRYSTITGAIHLQSCARHSLNSCETSCKTKSNVGETFRHKRRVKSRVNNYLKANLAPRYSLFSKRRFSFLKF